MSPAVPVPAISPTLAERLSSSLSWNKAPERDKYVYIQLNLIRYKQLLCTLSVRLSRLHYMVDLVDQQSRLLSNFRQRLPGHADSILKHTGLLINPNVIIIILSEAFSLESHLRGQGVFHFLLLAVIGQI